MKNSCSDLSRLEHVGALGVQISASLLTFFCLSDQLKLEGRFCDLPEKEQDLDSSVDEDTNKLAYCVTDVPPWYLCILLGTQVCQ